jgi:hypothetical protein
MKGPPTREFSKPTFAENCTTDDSPPIGKQKRYPALDLTVIHASEVGVPLGRKPILWKLVTDLEVADLDAAIEEMRWYSTRWKIKVFHKILK